jgi:hypothetical protein
MFPQEWKRDPDSPYLVSAFHDVPFDEPELALFYGFHGSNPSDLRGKRKRVMTSRILPI